MLQNKVIKLTGFQAVNPQKERNNGQVDRVLHIEMNDSK